MSSTTPGYVRPSTEFAAPLGTDDFTDALQAAVVGMTGLLPEMVRPRWQPNPPQEPSDPATDWCAIGIVSHTPEPGLPAVMHHGSGAVGDTDAGPLPGGWDEMQRHETVAVIASFYGANSVQNACTLREGLFLSQNRATLQQQGLGVIETSDVTQVPDLVNNAWRGHADLHMKFYRLIKRAYPVRNINRASGVVASDSPHRLVDWDTDRV